MLASQQVLQRMAQLLAAAGTPSADRVHTDRFHPISVYPSTRLVVADEDLSADEDGDDITWPQTSLHDLQVDVHVHCQAVAGLDAAMAQQAAAVLVALGASVATTTLQPLAGCTLQARRISYQASSEAEAATGTATVRYQVFFRTRSNDPETLI